MLGGVDAWVVEALRVGYRIPFDCRPPLSERPLSLPAYSPQSIKGVALTQELQTLLRKGAVEPAPQSPGFYSCLFLVQKASGSWRPIIDLSTLNVYITSSHFHMETPQSVLRSIRPGDWMVSLDLQDAYLQVPVHHDSRRYLRFVVAGKSYQFRVLCFGLTTAPQVFTRIMAPVSAILHKYGVRMLRYLDDWLILASTELACLQSRDRLLSICTELGIQVNLTKSSLVPTQSLVYLGMEIRSLPFIARPTVAGQLVFCRRLSTRLNYQARCGTYRKWCRDFGHRSSSPSIAKIADFLTYMFKRKGAALATIKGYRAMLSAVFKFPLPEISTSPILKDVIRSFEISAPRPLFPPPPWDLDKVLQYLSGPPFEPLARASFLDKTKKALFLLAMATAKRFSELQALSFSVSFQGEDLVLYYDLFFSAKTESAANPLPRSVIVPSLSDFAGDLPERVQCPVRAIKFLRKAARSASYIPSRLFVSPRNLERAMSKNAMSFYL